MASEIISGNEYTDKVDVYSFDIWDFFSEEPIYNKMNPKDENIRNDIIILDHLLMKEFQKIFGN